MELQGELDSGEELSVAKRIIEPNVSFQKANGNGRGEEIRTHESLGIRIGSSAFNAFAIRGYVAGIRKVDISQCWPFSPHLLERRLQEGSKYLLPPLEIPMHRYWGCLDCVGNITSSEDLVCQRDVDQEFDASNADAFATNGPQGLLDGLSGKENLHKSHDTFKENGPEEENVAPNELVDVRSFEENICNVKDEVAKDKALEYLTTQKLSWNLKGDEANQSHSKSDVEKDACAIQAVSKVGKAQKKRLIADLIATLPSDQIRCNAGNHNCAQTSKVKTVFHRSKIVKNKGGSKDVCDNLKKFKGKRKCISNLHTASLQTNIPSERSHSESLEMRRKRQRLGVVVQSSSSTRPFEAYPVAKNRLQHINPAHNTAEELNASGKPEQLGSRDCFDTVRNVNIKRMARGGELVNTVAMKGRKDKESVASKSKRSADLKSMEKSGLSLREGLVHIPAEAVLSDGQMDLVAGGRNQQMDQVRQSLMPEKLDVSGKSAEAGTTPETWDRVVSGSRDFSDTMTRIGEEYSGFRGNLINSAASKGQENANSSICERKRSEGLVREQDALRCIPSEVDLENGHVVLVPIRNQQTNRMRHSLIPDNLHVLEQAMEAGANSEKGDGIASGSRHCLDILTRTGNESMVNRGKLARYVVKKGQMNNGPCNSRRKNFATHKYVKKRKAFAKKSRSHVAIIEETNAALNAALANARTGRSAFGNTVTQGHSNCWDQHFHSGIAKSIALESLQTTVRGDFSSAQKLLETVVSPTSKIGERLLVDHCCTRLTLNSQGLLADSSPTHDKNLELKVSYPKDNDFHKQMNCSKLVSPAIVSATVYNSQIGMSSPALRKEAALTHSTVQLIDRNFTFPSRTGDAGQTDKNQVALKYGTSWVQSPSHDDNVSVLRALAMQPSRSATCLPVKSFIGANGSQYLASSSGSYAPMGCILPYVTFTASSMISRPDWVEHSNHSMPLISSPAFSIAQGNNIGIPTALSEETFSRNKYDLQSYIQERIEAYRPSWASGSGDPRKTATTMAEKSASKLPKVDKTSSRAMSSCNPHGNPKADVGSLESYAPNQIPSETLKNNGEMPTKQGIQRTMYSKSGRVLTVNQALQPEIMPLAPADLHTKTKDFSSKLIAQSKAFEPTHVLDTKDLAAHASQHQKFGKKPVRMVMNVQSGCRELEPSRRRIVGMHGSGGSADYEHFLKPPVAYNKDLCLPINTTVPFAQTPMLEKYFHGVHKTNTDKHGRFPSPLDKSFTMQERQFLSYSHFPGNILFGIMPDTSTSENTGVYSGKTVYGNPDMMGFVRPAVRDEAFLFPGKIIGESSVKTGDKEDPDNESHCRDAALGLSLSSTHVGPEKKHGNETGDKLNTVTDSPWQEVLAASPFENCNI